MEKLKLLTHDIWKEYQNKYIELGIKNEVIKSCLDEMMNDLVNRIHDHYGLIQIRLHNEGGKNIKLYSNSTFGSCSYVVKSDGSSEYNLKVSIKSRTNWDKAFLHQKVPPKFGYVYFLKSKFGYKIGKTSNLKKRMRVFGVKLPFETELKYIVKTPKYNELEKDLHEYFKKQRINGEWFDLSNIQIDEVREYLKENDYTLKEELNC